MCKVPCTQVYLKKSRLSKVSTSQWEQAQEHEQRKNEGEQRSDYILVEEAAKTRDSSNPIIFSSETNIKLKVLTKIVRVIQNSWSAL
jgi:hypothetical protein